MKFLFSFLLAASLATAQTGNIRGRVQDQSGALVPAATVVLHGPAGAVTTTTDATGVYSFRVPVTGEYRVEASAPNLVQVEAVKLTFSGGVQVVDLHLKIADVVQKVTVQDSAGAAVSTAAADNASALVLSASDLDALPDDPDDLQSDLQALAGPSAGPGGGSIYIDGFSNGEIPPKSSIREIRINQNPFSPEYDKLGYGRVDILTKPGSDRYRGTMNYNLGSQVWNSRNPYSAEKAPFLLNEFEGDAGGPLGKRASFTLDAQRNLVDNGSITSAVIVDPVTLAISPLHSTITTPQRLTRVSPRIDYQLNANNTLVVRYGVTHANIQEAGIGAFDLVSRGHSTVYTNQTAQVSETAVFGTVINETRFQFYRAALQQIANNPTPELQVLGAFNGGGSQLGRSSDAQNSYELQNYTSMLKGAHSVKFGIRARAQADANISPLNFNGTFTFTSIQSYQQTLLQQGGRAAQFSISAGTPGLSVHQFDAGLFAGDEWKVRPNVTLNLGVRYEAQTNIHDWRDIAPRVALAWAPGSTVSGKRAKTVIRTGFGMFYDRFALTNTLAAERFNGLVQQQYVVTNPDFYPVIPAVASLAAFASTQVTERISSQIRAPYLMQSVISVERQLPANTTLAVTYTNAHGLHELRSRDVNAPLPGSGIYPLGNANPLFLTESAGVYNQNQLIANVNARVNGGVSLFGFYVLNKAMSNTDGVGTSPANPYNFSGEYGPALTDVRHRVTFGGSVTTKWNVRFSPFMVRQSGVPFNITSGQDEYGTTLFNARPGIATDLTRTGLVRTAYGLLDPNPTAGETILGRNYGRGPGQVSFNLRVAKTIGFGAERGGAKKTSAPAGGMINPASAATGRGLGGLIGPPITSHRYNLTLAVSARNLLNHLNPGPIIGNITSPLFGQANQVGGTPNGEGFYETANNRRLELQIRFAF